MGQFLNPLDIANRACQHVGVDLISTAQGFAEVSRAAQHIGVNYPKLRRAELQRNIWKFATRTAILRAIDTNTLLLSPTAWQSGATYFVGSIVADTDGYLWISRVQNNLGNQPGNATGIAATDFAWEPYYGPLTVALYDSSQTYYSGEVVYTAAGDGTANIYLSKVNANAVHPALPNQWSTYTTYFKNDVVQAFPAWSSGTTYTVGQTVAYTDGLIYSSLVNANLGNPPNLSFFQWAPMPTLTLETQAVPITSVVQPPSQTAITEWSQTESYALGDFVLFNGLVYVSLTPFNTGNFPDLNGVWAVTTGGTLYMSAIDLNFGNDPTSATVNPPAWSSATTYAINALVAATDGLIYKSLQNGNLNHNPANGAAPTFWQNTGVLDPWVTTFVQGGGNSQWTQIGGASFPAGVALKKLDIIYPINTGPTQQLSTRNIFRLPANYLREAPQDSRAGSSSSLGTPGHLYYTDWEYENDFIRSRDVLPIVYRFVADFTDVARMNDMFCEGLGARIALESCQVLTQSSAKLADIGKLYERFMGEARIVNGIETGPTEEPLDDYIACRI
jgi:hypothetical protein